jgi:hypothetical protein
VLRRVKELVEKVTIVSNINIFLRDESSYTSAEFMLDKETQISRNPQ